LIDKRIAEIETQMAQALRLDQESAHRTLAQIRHRRRGRPAATELDRKLDRLAKRLAQSVAARRWRQDNCPQITYNQALPICTKTDEIIAAIVTNPVVIVSGETGSGKTTQIPKFCLAAGRGIEGQIGCTQPRRIAAMTVASRIAEELGQPLGQAVGYKIRFQDRTDRKTFIKIMTDGILLAETQRDPGLYAYDTIIVDEAHERSLNIDFILGYLKNLLSRRRDLKIIITSATIDTEKFSMAFDRAPVIEVSGRMFPVETIYRSVSPADENDDEMTYLEMAVEAVEHLVQGKRPGDMLIFMPTEQDIRTTCEMLTGRRYRDVTVMPLYARLSATEQKRVFQQGTGRKIIVATNIAETSITIPGIRYVIDTGLARISEYLPRSRTTALPVVPISRSSADQRKGRCGRVADGVCLRLYSEDDYDGRPLFTQPEILRANLAEVILRMIALRLGPIEAFPFIDPPAAQSIKDGFDLLLELGAIENRQPHQERSSKRRPRPPSRASHKMPRVRLTQDGRLMARLPIDPRLSRIIIEGRRRACLDDIIVIAAALSLQDPRERPLDQEQAADNAQAVFKDPFSDFLTLLNIWQRCHAAGGAHESTSRFKKFCRAHFLSFKRMREWRDIHSQILSIVQEYGLRSKNRTALTRDCARAAQADLSGQDTPFKPYYADVHCSILSGFLSNIAQKKEHNLFKATKGREVMIFPGSGLFNRAGDWIVAAEMVETSRLFARTVARIDPHWIETLAPAQCKRTHMHPHWERNRGEVVALEQVSLFGLIIVPQRPVAYGRINPEEATEIFIREALIQGDLKNPLPFMRFNQNRISEIEAMENRLRRRDLLIDEETLLQFYINRLANVCSLTALQQKIKQMGDDRFLRLQREDLLAQTPDAQALALFPDRVTLGTNRYDCDYRFDPGQAHDGVSVKIPLAEAAAVDLDAVDWLVPGLFKEKVSALVKGLPKSYRKHLVPLARTIDLITAEMPRVGGNLFAGLTHFIRKRFKLDIPITAWPQATLPEHLKMRFVLIGSRGETLHTGRDKTVLAAASPEIAGNNVLEELKKTWEVDGITSWDFEDVAESVTLKSADGRTWLFYPGLQSEGNAVRLTLFPNQEKALTAHKAGVAALYSLHFAKELKFLRKSIALPADLAPAARWFGGLKAVEQRLYDQVLTVLFSRNIRTREAFYAQADTLAREGIHRQGRDILQILIPLLQTYHETRQTLSSLESANRANIYILGFLETMKNELERLVPENFLSLYSHERLVHLDRYVRAIALRARKAVLNLEKDRQRAGEIAAFTDLLKRFLAGLSERVSVEKRQAIETFHWMIEEYKISIFAQEIKTSTPVSAKRLEQQARLIEKML
jgi:ATP-dependent helicase HrpA